jgi:hypothetical protein
MRALGVGGTTSISFRLSTESVARSISRLSDFLGVRDVDATDHCTPDDLDTDRYSLGLFPLRRQDAAPGAIVAHGTFTFMERFSRPAK